MHPLLKYLPPLLTLLVPLGLLAWFGSRELSRLEDRSLSMLQQEAHRFLQNEERKVRGEIEKTTSLWLGKEGVGSKLHELLTDEEVTLVQASRELGEEPFILGAFVADADYALIAPRPPRTRLPSAPLHRFPTSQDSESRELLRADILKNMEDREGAIELLESYLRTHRSSRERAEGVMWAYFHLAGLLDRDGDPDSAIYNYDGASIKAQQICQRTPTEDAAAVIVLSELKQAEILLNVDEMIRVLERVSTDSYEHMDLVGEDVLDYVVASISSVVETVARSDPERARTYVERRDNAIADNHVRQLGRRFALEYETRTPRELRANEGRRYEHKGIVFHALQTAHGPRLLAMRPARHGETRRTDGAAWIGLVVDLPALVGSSLSGIPTSRPGNLALAVSDTSGHALLSDSKLDAAVLARASGSAGKRSQIQLAPVESPIAGLEFAAIPLRDTAEIQSTARNQVILGLILVVIAAGGAFLLIRSVKRETELAQMKVHLLSRVSHELKTPLAVIKMYGETLGLGRVKDQEQASQFAGIISAEADRLTSMVERILDFSKMEAGTFTYDKQRIDLSELVEAITAEYQPQAESKGIALRDDITDGLMADVDPRALASSLYNLLENAVKYTAPEASEPTLDVSLQRQNGSAVLEVADRGVGIPRDELDKVFGDFYRASNAGEVRGSGLGLSLVGHFANSHDGKVEALARPEGGTILRLTLPLATEPTANGAGPEPKDT